MDENNNVPEETITQSVEVPAEEVAETPVEEAAGIPAEPVADVPQLMFAGQVVVTDGVRTVNGNEMHHLTLADGSSQDVSDEDYAAAVEASK